MLDVLGHYPNYITYIPRRVRLNDGSITTVLWEEALRDNVYLLYVGRDNAGKVCAAFREKGFRDTVLSIPKKSPLGSDVLCSVSKVLTNPWEHHVRVYRDGFVESEVEISREYIEHLSENRINVIYETYEIYRNVYDKMRIYHKPSGKWVVEVLDQWRIELTAPRLLIPWRPLAITGLVMAVMGLTAYALSKLEGPT